MYNYKTLKENDNNKRKLWFAIPFMVYFLNAENWNAFYSTVTSCRKRALTFIILATAEAENAKSTVQKVVPIDSLPMLDNFT